MTNNHELKLTNAFNVRDLGGYPTLDGRLIKSHRLVRGSYLSSLNFADQKQLFDYGIRVIIDLRTSKEVAKYPDRFIPSTRYVKLPVLDAEMGDAIIQHLVFSGAVPNYQAGLEHMLRLYCRLIVSPQAQQAYRKFLLTIARFGEIGGILFHCSTGKDRTGIATILLLHLLGVDPATIRDDYLLTNQMSTVRINQRMNEARHFSTNPAYLKSIFDISTVKVLYYQFVDAVVSELYGGFGAYLKTQLGVDDELVARLRRLFLRPEQ